MSYKITFEPVSNIKGVRPTTVELEDAAEAWMEVYGLMNSNEKVDIFDADGAPISWQELKTRAQREAS